MDDNKNSPLIGLIIVPSGMTMARFIIKFFSAKRQKPHLGLPQAPYKSDPGDFYSWGDGVKLKEWG
ncbi:hypothetical protein ACP3P6_01720 [Enterobacter mori]